MFDLELGLRFALRGIMYAIAAERNFRLQWLLGMMVLLGIDLLALAFWQEIVLFLLVFLVLALELHNCAIEKTCDSTGRGHHDDKKHAKDFSAASVLLLAIAAASILLLFLHGAFESLLASFFLNPWAFTALAIIFLSNLPIAVKREPVVWTFILFAVSLLMDGVFIFFFARLQWFVLMGAGFHLIMAMVFTNAVLGARKTSS
ncbi:MAG TPA: diacylglycerol kinase [Myxococcota bacterium]|nr:diacylglycerol kinase [Myxococcota bacterium]